MNRSFLHLIGEIAQFPRELVRGGQPVVRWSAAVVIDSWVEVSLLEVAS